MKTLMAALAVVGLLAFVSNAHSQRTSHSVSVNAVTIGDPATGAVFLSGGGTYDAQSGFLHLSGAFRATSDIHGGPLAGLKAGEGVRWEASQILPSSGFKCSSSAAEPLKTAVTDDDTVVIQALFFRAGDGSNTLLTAKLFVSAADEDPAQPGTQNVWIQGVGCGEAIVNFN